MRGPSFGMNSVEGAAVGYSGKCIATGVGWNVPRGCLVLQAHAAWDRARLQFQD